MLIKAKSKTDLGFIVTLTGDQDLLVAKGVTVQSIENSAVYATSGHHDITVRGTVIGAEYGIELSGMAIGNRVMIDKGAEVSCVFGGCVHIEGLNSMVINRGRIFGYDGIVIDGAGPGTARIDNYGLMALSDFGVYLADTQASVFRNFGQLYASGLAAFSGQDLRDVVINRGTMAGNVQLYGGNDLYDGQGGIFHGSIIGGIGDDTFRPGRGAEYLNGASDFDTVDYRATGAVKIALDGAFISRNGAVGDSFNEIERVFGSAKGDDTIRGDETANELYGFGGNDRIFAGDGVDRVIGGAGRDIINLTDVTAVFANDRILFDAPSEGRDSVSGFGVNDEIEINRDGFRGALALGTLAASQFKSGGNNQAGDNNDRFIFNTVNGTLWFDRDGAKGVFDPVLLVDFMDATALTALNITIF